MKQILKKICAVILAASTAATVSTGITAGAEEIYKGDFFKDKYIFCIDENDIQEKHLNTPLPGKTEISFDFSLNAPSEVRITAQEYESGAKTDILSLNFAESGNGFDLKGENIIGSYIEIAAGIESGKIYHADIQIDLNEGIYNAVLYEGRRRNRLLGYVKSISLGGTSCCGIEGISADFAISQLTISRERAAADTPVINLNGGIASVGSKINNIISDEEYTVYAAFYTDDTERLSGIKAAQGVYKGYDDYIEVFFPLSDSFKQTCSVALFVFKDENIYPLAKKAKIKLCGANALPQDYLAYTSFEENESYTDKSDLVECKALPNGWGAQSWNGPDKPFGAAFEPDGRGRRCISLSAAEKGFYGITKYISPPPQNGLSISLDVKCSNDYSGNVPKIVVIYFDSAWKTLRSDFTQIKNVTAGKWKHESIYISPSDYPEGATRVQIAFCTVYSSSSAAGKLYYDSLCVDNNVFEMECDEKLGWYNMGDTVCYKPTVDLCDAITEITGAVYDSDGALITKETVSAEEAGTNGWRYTPEDSGYYKVIFEAQTNDGHILYEHNSYKAYYDDNTKSNLYIEKASHDFYVTPYERKDFSQRNKLYGMSIGNYDGEYDLDIADRLGMSFVRLHAFSWKDIEPENVTADNGKEYDWTKYDKILNRIGEGKLDFDVIGNVLYTPKWASSSNDDSGTMVEQYASYAPADMSYLTEFLTDLYERYGDKIDTWEIYNEPNLPGGSVFWRDTPDNYVELLQSAYTTLKTLSENKDEVDMGGIGAKRYLSFYRQFLDKGGSDYTDKLVMHGYDLDPWNYLNINSQLGLEDKQVINTEAHMILFNGSSDSVYFNEKQLALRMIGEYLRQIKYGVERIAFFQPYDNSIQGEDLMILDNSVEDWDWTTVAAGLFRKKPNWEPRFAAGALNTLIAQTGSVTEYADEYKTGNVNIVKLTADDAPLYVLWCDNLAEPSSEANLSGISSAADIRDWEGRSVLADGFKPSENNVYFIKGISDDAFSYLNSAKGDKVYNGAVLYSENERTKTDTSTIKGSATANSLFDYETETLSVDGNTQWNELSKAWGSNINANFAVHLDESGFECIVKTNNTDYNKFVKKQIAVGIDTFANGIQSDVVELTADVQDGTVKKTAVPNIGGDLPFDGFAGKGDVISGAKTFEKTVNGEIYYCMYVPIGQLYPYFYTANSSINMGLRFTCYSSTGGIPVQYHWSSGYSASKPASFGTINAKN